MLVTHFDRENIGIKKCLSKACFLVKKICPQHAEENIHHDEEKTAFFLFDISLSMEKLKWVLGKKTWTRRRFEFHNRIPNEPGITVPHGRAQLN